MADDWIKMRESLHEDPAILEMAERLQTRPEHVVGYCHRFWSWVSRNCLDGVVHGVSLVSLGSVLSMPNFPELLCDVGWLEYTEKEGQKRIFIPKFDRHLSQGAKTRALATEKKRNQRLDSVPKLSRNCPSEKGTREEKRRDISKDISTDAFDEFWNAFPKGRKGSPGLAREAFLKATLKAEPATIISAAKEYAASDTGRGKYVKGPTPWLNQECWNDDRQAWRDKDAPATESAYRAISREEFTDNIKMQRFKDGPHRNAGNPNWVFGALRDGSKVECKEYKKP